MPFIAALSAAIMKDIRRKGNNNRRVSCGDWSASPSNSLS
jgi:hypothetical protein